MFTILLMVAAVLEYVLLGMHGSTEPVNSIDTLQANFQNTYPGGILILVAFINASIGFYQIQKYEAILASFLAMTPPACQMERSNVWSKPKYHYRNGITAFAGLFFSPPLFYI
ncbi:hypothetical protein BYT27DRAFT_7287231 [Phlegmacium glaucopus]|nr:hypothetical protein BYT27DRAFT_7287231 [Phlegmacium glaucopus]